MYWPAGGMHSYRQIDRAPTVKLELRHGGAPLSGLARCHSLKKLSLQQTDVDDDGVATIASLESLEELDLGCCGWISCFAPLSSCLLLKNVDLSYTMVVDADIAVIVYLPALTVLNLSTCNVVTTFEPLAVCHLKRLNLSFTKVSSRSLAVASRPARWVSRFCCFLQKQYALRTIVAIKNAKRGMPMWYIVDVGLPRMVAAPREGLFMARCGVKALPNDREVAFVQLPVPLSTF